MKKFLVLYNMPAEAFEAFKNATDEEKKKEMDDWVAWMNRHPGVFVDEGNASANNKRVTKDGVEDAPNEVGGYSIVQADSHESACAIFADAPHLDAPGAYVEVMEITEM